MSLRLEEKPFEFEGKTWILRCNMAAIEDVQDQHDGDLNAVLAMPALKAQREFLAAMLNEYAAEQGWPERFTETDLRRKLTPAMILPLDILGMVTRALVPASAQVQVSAADTPPEDTGN